MSADITSDDVASVTDGNRSTGRGRLVPLLAAVAAALVIALIALVVFGRGDDSSDASTPLLNQPAPAAAGQFADGTPWQLNRRQGSWVVLNFFADNCVPCVLEHPELIRFVDQQRSIGTAGAEFYSIVQYGRPVDAVEEFFAERGGDWPVVYDERGEFSTGFGVSQVPETWVIDPDGIVRARITGEVRSADWLSSQLQDLRELLS